MYGASFRTTREKILEKKDPNVNNSGKNQYWIMLPQKKSVGGLETDGCQRKKNQQQSRKWCVQCLVSMGPWETQLSINKKNRRKIPFLFQTNIATMQ